MQHSANSGQRTCGRRVAPSNPQTLKPSNPQPSNPQTLKAAKQRLQPFSYQQKRLHGNIVGVDPPCHGRDYWDSVVGRYHAAICEPTPAEKVCANRAYCLVPTHSAFVILL